MKYIYISVEGQTEETFVNKILRPHLEPRDIWLQPVLLKTRRMPEQPTFKGGYITYAKIKKELLTLLNASSIEAITTMYDFYGLPHDFPGYEDLPETSGAHQVRHLEQAVAQDIADHRFHPYLQLHEFEALLFTDPGQISEHLCGTEKKTRRLKRICQEFPNPEEINDNPQKSPSHRIRDLFPDYEKVSAGYLIAEKIGLAQMRNACQHFDSWVSWLESLG
jgi:hypothetical protein